MKRVFLRLLALPDLLWRIPLGLLFIYAAAGKIYDPGAFALIVDNYRLLPDFLVPPVALILPWLELWAGLLVLIGPFKKPAALWLALMLVVFMGAVSFNLYRGLDFECGCFGSAVGRQAGYNLLWQDALMLFGAVMVLRPGKRPSFRA